MYRKPQVKFGFLPILRQKYHRLSNNFASLPLPLCLQWCQSGWSDPDRHRSCDLQGGDSVRGVSVYLSLVTFISEVCLVNPSCQSWVQLHHQVLLLATQSTPATHRLHV